MIHKLYTSVLLSVLFVASASGSAANVARDKPAYQYGGNSDHAGRAVDGNTDPDDSDTCTFIDTGDNSTSAWWYVDLGSVYDIHNVTVYNTNSDPEYQYLEEADLLRSTADSSPPSNTKGCNSFVNVVSRGQSTTRSCHEPARYIMIQKKLQSDTRKSLSLCEVVVMATVKDCGGLSTPNNGEVTYSDGTTYQSVATYSCHTGFELDGDRTRTCSADGTWTGSEPQCIVKDCGGLSTPNNGGVTYSDSTTYQSVATYSCDTGFELDGDRRRTCSAQGTWTGSEPQCIVKNCGGLSTPNNGEVTYSDSTTYQSVATYSCDTGFELDGDRTRTCSAQGTWTGSEPQCIVKDCGGLSTPNNGEVTHSDGTTYQSVATYSCDTGFELDGDRTRTCSADGTWTGSEPQCIVATQDCSELWKPTNGQVLQTGTTYQSVATYNCDPGFELVGDRTRTCSADGDWSGSKPECRASSSSPTSTSSTTPTSTSTRSSQGTTTTVSSTTTTPIPDTSTRGKTTTVSSTTTMSIPDISTQGETSAVFSKTTTSMPDKSSQGGTSKKSSEPDSLPMILGIVFGVLAAIILLIIVIVCLKRRNKKKSEDKRGLQIDTPHRMESRQNNNNEGYENRALVSFDESDNLVAGTSHKPTGIVPPLKLLQKQETEMKALYGNVSDTKVPLNKLEEYIQKKHKEANGFKNEYGRLPAGLKAKADTASKHTAREKNRYLNVQAYDHSRVQLDIINGDEDSDYINANFIDGYADKERFYVATQGPKKETLGDFWRMLWILNTDKVIMITKVTENGKRKCEPYWPESVGGVKKFAYVTVTTVSVDHFADYTVRILSAQKEGESETRNIRQLHFTSWTDKSIPEQKFPLMEFRKKVRSMYNPTKGPMVVHCSAGVGRTGTFIALDYLLDQAAAEQQVDVHQCVHNMRNQRMNMVQTLQQYIFIYDTLFDVYKAGDKAIPCENFPATYYTMKNDPTQLEQQFMELNALTASTISDDTSERAGLSEENLSKNRDVNIVPADRSRPFLMRCDGFHNDYINAVFVPGFKQKNGSIATQMPMQQTVTDFWRLVWDHGSKIIVMLNHLDPEEISEEVNGSIYWPDEEDPVQQYGPIQVELTLEESEPGFTVRNFKIRNTLRSNEDPFTVRQFQAEDWPVDCALPLKPSTFTNLLESVQSWQKSAGNGPILVHCMNGASRSGLFCAGMYMIEKLKEENEVNVFTSIRFVRLNRPQFIESKDQYIFLHDLALEFLNKYDMYANFKM